MTIAAPRALLVCAPNWIGDAVMATPTLAALRAGFPDARITVLGRAGVVDVLIGHPAIDEMMLDDRRGGHRGAAGRLRLASDLRGRGFDTALLLPNSFASALVAALARVPARVGYRTDGRGPLLTTALAPPRKPAPHMTAYYLGLLAPWSLAGDPRAVRLAVTDAERDAASRRLAEWGIGRDERVVGVNPGAAYGSAKRWPADRFAAVSRRLVQDGAAVLVLGAASERGLADAVAAGLGRRAVNAAGMTTMREAMALMARCGHVVTNDSGPMHVAAALGVPVTAVFGPTEPRATSPVGERVTILQRPVDCAPCRYRECPIDHRCMTGVGVDEVYAAVANAASENPPIPPLSKGGKRGLSRDP